MKAVKAADRYPPAPSNRDVGMARADTEVWKGVGSVNADSICVVTSLTCVTLWSTTLAPERDWGDFIPRCRYTSWRRAEGGERQGSTSRHHNQHKVTQSATGQWGSATVTSTVTDYASR